MTSKENNLYKQYMCQKLFLQKSNMELLASHMDYFSKTTI